MCAFQIGLYALGLHNRVSPNWLSRTYSSHVSWIGGQAMEIGVSAISFLIGTWEGHLTPPEAASMADKASKTRDNAMVIDIYTTIFTVWKFHDFSITQTLREINFWESRTSKTAIFAIFWALTLVNLVIFSLPKVLNFINSTIQNL